MVPLELCRGFQKKASTVLWNVALLALSLIVSAPKRARVPGGHLTQILLSFPLPSTPFATHQLLVGLPFYSMFMRIGQIVPQGSSCILAFCIIPLLVYFLQ